MNSIGGRYYEPKHFPTLLTVFISAQAQTGTLSARKKRPSGRFLLTATKRVYASQPCLDRIRQQSCDRCNDAVGAQKLRKALLVVVRAENRERPTQVQKAVKTGNRVVPHVWKFVARHLGDNRVVDTKLFVRVNASLKLASHPHFPGLPQFSARYLRVRCRRRLRVGEFQSENSAVKCN